MKTDSCSINHMAQSPPYLMPIEDVKNEPSTFSNYTLPLNKAAEAEDLLGRRQRAFTFPATKLTLPGLRREAESIFTHREKIEELLDENLKVRNGHMWSCTRRIPLKEGGNVYEYTLDNNYFFNFNPDSAHQNYIQVGFKNYIQKIEEIRPAIEPAWGPLKRAIEIYPQFADLGFGFKETLGVNEAGEISISRRAYAPDDEALDNLWEKLRERYPQLPPLDLVVNYGIASDRDYGIAHIIYDIMLSVGKESIHDDYFHVFSTIKNIFASILFKDKQHLSYEKNRYANHQMLLVLYRRLEIGTRVLTEKTLSKTLKINKRVYSIVQEHLDKFAMVFGYLADVLANNPDYLENKNVEEFKFTTDSIWDGRKLQNFVKNRFNIHDIEKRKLIRYIWPTLKSIEFLFDCDNFLRSNSSLDPSHVDISPLFGSRKTNIALFLEICRLFPKEEPQNIAHVLGKSYSRESFLPFAQKWREENGSFNKAFALHMAENLSITEIFNKISESFSDKYLPKATMILCSLLTSFKETHAVAIIEALHEHRMTATDMLKFTNQLAHLGKNWKVDLNSVDNVISWLKNQNPWEVIKVLRQTEDADFDALINVAKLLAPQEKTIDEVYQTYKMCGRGVHIFIADFPLFINIPATTFAQIANQIFEDLAALDKEAIRPL